MGGVRQAPERSARRWSCAGQRPARRGTREVYAYVPCLDEHTILARSYGLSGSYMTSCIFHGCLPPSPWEGYHAVHMKPATQSTGRLPPNPWESCHPVHVKPATWTTGRLPPTPGETCLSRSAATLGGLVFFHRCSFCQPRLPFPHGFALQDDLVGIRHEAVEDRIGQRRIPQGLIPVLDWQRARSTFPADM